MSAGDLCLGWMGFHRRWVVCLVMGGGGGGRITGEQWWTGGFRFLYVGDRFVTCCYSGFALMGDRVRIRIEIYCDSLYM